MTKPTTTLKTRTADNEIFHGSNLKPDFHDIEDSDHDCPTSSIAFHSIKRKVLRELYGLDDNHTYNHQLLKDKSPKGSVDEDIRPIVDLINSHPSFVTLSSCSGRIALFNPVSGKNTSSTSAFANDALIDDERPGEEHVEILESKGKGYGSWLLSSHAEISNLQLIESLDTLAHELNSTNTTTIPTLFFKHEPLLLHVAASHLAKAQILLQLALDLGFRESGIVYTAKRVTVAIRCHSLALNVPLAPHGSLRPCDNYLHGLVYEANTRFKMNQHKLKLFYEKIETTLFTHVPRNMIVENNDNDCIIQPEVSVHALPDLDLWGHAAVAVIPSTKSDSKGDVDVYIFGGYGVGPISTTMQRGNEQRKGSTRSKHVYLLKRRKSMWDSMWNHVPESCLDHSSPELISYDTQYGKLYAKRTSFSPCEGLSACVLSCLNPNIIAIFGGRESPLKPSNKFYLFDCSGSHHNIEFSEPLDVAGASPSRRWGHSIVALSGNCGHLAIVIGGRDEYQILPDAFILSFEATEATSEIPAIKLTWSQLYIGAGFYHPSVVALPTNKDSTQDDVYVFGGYRKLDDPFSTFSKTQAVESEGEDMHILLTKGSTSITKLASLGTCFGDSCVLIPTKSNSNRIYFLFAGGFDSMAKECSRLRGSPLNLRPLNKDSNLFGTSLPCNLYTVDSDSQTLNFSSMVHHVALSVPLTTPTAGFAHEVLILGGGTSLFAFGESFAKSYTLSVYLRCRTSSINHIQLNLSQNKVESNSDSPTSVLFVKKCHAKKFKTALESSSCLDRRFRMIKASEDAPLDDPSLYVAVPVTKECLRQFLTLSENRLDSNSCDISSHIEWVQLAAGYGKQKVPYSSAYFGSRKT